MSLKSSANALILATAVTSAEAGIDNKSNTQSITSSSENIEEVVSYINQTKSAAEQAVSGVTSLKMDVILGEGGEDYKDNKSIFKESTLPLLVGDLPIGYFEKGDGVDFYEEIKDGLGVNVALTFKNYALDFSSIVKKGSEEEIIDILSGLYNNPDDTDLFQEFILTIEKNLKDNETVDTSKILNLSNLLSSIGEQLNSDMEEINLALATKEDLLRNLEQKIKDSELELKKIRSSTEKTRSRIIQIEELIIQRKKDIKLIEGKANLT